MMVVVSDTSPIRALRHLDLDHLLHALFGDVLIPPAVERELERPPARYAPILVSQITGVRVEVPADDALVRELRLTLDDGESEAIALAVERSGSLLLIDEAAGRSEATRRGVKVTGALGVLLRAKSRGMIPLIAPLIDDLQSTLGFHVSDRLTNRIIQLAGE